MSNLEIINDLASKIHELHTAAQAHAETAIKHAAEAGKLLLDLKQRLPHGQFSAYVSKNMSISIRQCQRYMSAARGKSKQVLSDMIVKSDTMSHLAMEKRREIFLPFPGWAYVLLDKEREDLLALVEPAAGYPEYFFVTVYQPGSDHSKQTVRPVESCLVHDSLESFGLYEAHKLKWRQKKSDGAREPEETLFGPSGRPVVNIQPLNAPRPINIETGEIDWDYPYRCLELPAGYPSHN